MIERGQRLARMLRVGVRHRRVLAHDVHAADLAALDRLHHLDHRQTRLAIEPRTPQRLEARGGVGIVDAAVVRIHHRDQPGVRGALHIVLAAQRMQARAGPADLARHQRQRDQAARVVGAVHVLRHAHAPQDHRAAGGRVEPRDMADRLRVDAADRRHRLGAVGGDIAFELVVADRAAVDEVAIDQPLGDDHMHHRVQQRDVGIRLELQEAIGEARQVRAARIGDDQLGAVAHRVLDPARRDRMIDGRVGADQDHHLGLADVDHRVGHRPRADPFQQRRHRRRMAQPRAMVDVIAAEAGPHQLLEQIGLLVAALGRAEAGQRPLAVGIANAREAAAGQRQRLFPRRLAEHLHHALGIHHRIAALGHALAAHQRHRQPMRMRGVVETVAPLDAEPRVIGGAIAPFHVLDAVVLDVIGQLAADTAVRADRLHLLVRHRQRGGARRHQRAGRAGLHAFAAGHAGRRAHRVVHVEHDLRVGAA